MPKKMVSESVLHEHNVECNHKFHKECVDHWLQVGASEQPLCPICKACTRTEMIAAIRKDLMKKQPEVSILLPSAN